MVTDNNNDKIKTVQYASEQEQANRKRLCDQMFMLSGTIPHHEFLLNLGLFLTRQNLSHILFMNEIYQQILNVHGIVIEFGVRWGRNLALFESFRGVYEPFNHTRKIVGFDTFGGFPSIHEKDGNADIVSVGAINVPQGYEKRLTEVLECHEQESPTAHKKKYELVKGNASEQIELYLERNPETVIALAYFDFDLYEPTRDCLCAIKKHVTRGTILGFDQLGCHDLPGETIALRDVSVLKNLRGYKIVHSPFSPTQSYVVID